MNSIKENPILFTILLFLVLCFQNRFLFAAMVLCMLFWYQHTRDRSVMIFGMVCLLCVVPRCMMQQPTMRHARVVRTSSSYAVLKNGFQYVLVYPDEMLTLDGEYEINGTFSPIEKTNGFYRFDFQSWAHQNHCYYVLNQPTFTKLRQYPTIRSRMQTLIAKVQDTEQRTLLYKILLNIKSSETEQKEWYNENGFSYAGLIHFLDLILKYVLEEEHRKKFRLVLSCTLGVVYHFPLLLTMTILFQILSFSDMSSGLKTGLGLCITMMLYPASVLSFSFLIQLIFRLSAYVRKEQRSFRTFCIFIVQSVMFQQINILQNLLYPVLVVLYGMFWFCGFLDLILHTSFLVIVTKGMNFIIALLQTFRITGSCVGFGLLFFVLIGCLDYRKHHQFFRLNCLFIFFLLTGMFHPFAEVTFINVGQGNSALIRMPLNTGNVLIDTGKPSQQQTLDTFLKAKGVHHLDGLIITHADDDHSGNQEFVTSSYRPEIVVSEHQKEYEIGLLKMLDLNDVKNEDENESSIVNVFTMNQVNFCMMADVDQEVEEQIAQKYGNLSCTVLALSHHGSKTGSADRFLDQVKPEIGIISSGSYAIYHHPSEETVQKLLKRHIPYFDTKNEGDISFVFIGPFTMMITSAGKVCIV